MGRRKNTEFPRAKVHAASGRSRVRVCGREIWLGPAGSPEADRRYREILAAWVASGGKSIDTAGEPATTTRSMPTAPASTATPPTPAATTSPAESVIPDLTVGGLVIQYLAHIQAGRTKAELASVSKWWRAREVGNATYSRQALPVTQFGPRVLREIRDELANSPKQYEFEGGPQYRARTHVNRLVREIVTMFGWGVSEELVPVTVWQALKTTPHLRPGESKARETEKRQPVTDDHFEAVLPFLPPVVADLLRFARLASCRPDEAARLRMEDVEPAGAVFKWTLRKHKTQRTVGTKAIPIGPRAAAVMQRWAAGKQPADLVFSRADRDRVQVEGTIPMRTLRSKRQQFDTDQITKWVRTACDLAKTPRWTTYQLRHAGLTAVRRECGVEAEAAIAGWTTPKLAYHYAQLAFEEGAAAAAKLG